MSVLLLATMLPISPTKARCCTSLIGVSRLTARTETLGATLAPATHCFPSVSTRRAFCGRGGGFGRKMSTSVCRTSISRRSAFHERSLLRGEPLDLALHWLWGGIIISERVNRHKVSLVHDETPRRARGVNLQPVHVGCTQTHTHIHNYTQSP